MITTELPAAACEGTHSFNNRAVMGALLCVCNTLSEKSRKGVVNSRVKLAMLKTSAGIGL